MLRARNRGRNRGRVGRDRVGREGRWRSGMGRRLGLNCKWLKINKKYNL
jgi:hypothetical protein